MSTNDFVGFLSVIGN